MTIIVNADVALNFEERSVVQNYNTLILALRTALTEYVPCAINFPVPFPCIFMNTMYEPDVIDTTDEAINESPDNGSNDLSSLTRTVADKVQLALSIEAWQAHCKLHQYEGHVRM
jgi:hypothetical protein